MNLPQNLFDGNVSVQTFLCQPDKEVIGEIIPYDHRGTFKFNSYSEISFSVDRYYNDLFDGVTKVNPYYDLIESLRVIYLRGVGHFIIQDVSEDISEKESKSVTCFSLEYATGQKYLENFYVNTGEEGSIETMYHAQQYGAEYSIDNYYTKITNEKFDAYERYYIKEYTSSTAYNYIEVQILDETDYMSYELDLYIKKYPNVRFYWPTKKELSLLHHVFDRIPEWKIGHVDKELWYQERTFSEDRTAVYDFLYNTAAETLDFVMVWDSINGVVNFYKTTEDGVTADEEIETQWNTDVFISRENLASALDIKYSTDDIKTKLKITGSDTLDIRDVNLGQNYILNLSYYNTPMWLGSELYSKYNTYADDLEKYTSKYKELISAWSAVYNEYSDLMNYVPVEPRVMLIGDVFDKLYCVYGKFRRTLEYDGTKKYYTYEKGKYIEVSPAREEVIDKKNYYYIENVDAQLESLQTKLNTYKVDQENDGTRSPIAKTDDVLLTLENDDSDSVTIRIRYSTNNTNDKPDKSAYRVFRTLTRASTGTSSTMEFSLSDWIEGNLTAKKLELRNIQGELVDFRIKSIGTLGAYLCLVRDETNVAELEDYGIKLLEEKQATYTKIFIAQTEGYMNKEGSQCIASNEEPLGTDYDKGTKWLDTDTTDSNGKLIMKKWNGSTWETYTPAENEADYENYARFAENYTKLGNVQTVLAEKQRHADYLLNGIPVSAMYLSNNNINLNSLLQAAALHFIILKNDVYVTQLNESYPVTPTEGAIWIKTVNNGYALYTIIQQYQGEDWVEVTSDIKTISLTGYDSDDGIATFMIDPQYVKVKNTDEYSKNEIYFLLEDGKYVKPQIQPTNTDELINSGKTYYTIEGVEYAVYVNNGVPYVCYSHAQGMCLAKMNIIKEASDMSNYFTEQELVRLSPFIREDEYSDDNFLLTGYESEEELMNIKQELLNAGDEELKKICQPKLSFSATMANILAIPEFAPIRNQFKLGNFVKVGIREGYTKRARLLEVQINFDDPSDFSCTFGDLISTRSEIDKHAELLQQAVTAGKSVASNASKWQRGADKATALDDAINNGLRDAALSVGAADGQSIVWDKYGIRGRKLRDGSADEYEPQQFALINNKLVFTDDNWQTSRAVVGEFEIELPNDSGDMVKQNMYGLLADAIVGGYIQGTDIVGGSLKIGDGSNNYFQVDEKGDVKIVQAGLEKYATANALESIKKAYRYSVRLEYTGSTIITGNETTGTIIRAFVYDDGEEVKDLDSSIFSWKRSSGSGNDEEWNARHEKYGNTLTVTHEDVDNNTHFWCEVDI